MIRDYKLDFFRYFIQDRRAFIGYFILSMIVGGLELFGVALTYPFIYRLITNEKMDLYSLVFGILIIVAFIAKNVFMIFYNLLQANFTQNTEAYMNKKFMKFFIHGNYNLTSNISLSKKYKITGFLIPFSIGNYLLRILNLIVNVFIFSLLVGFLFVKYFVATCITLACSIVLLIIETLYLRHKTKILAKKISKSQEELNQATNIPLLNLKSIKIIKGEDYFFEKYCRKFDKQKEISKKLSFYNSVPPYITEPFIIIILLILLTIISFQYQSEASVLVASYAVVVSVAFRLAPTISRIQVNITGLYNSFPQVKELVEYYKEFELETFLPKVKEFDNFNSSIVLQDVSFAYKDKNVLNNINLKINKGEFIGIAGSSGIGKTTLVDLIAGLLEKKSGNIYIDDRLLNDDTLPKLKIGYIPQEYNTISASIRENVAFGVKDIDDEKVVEVLKLAQLYDYIEENFIDGIYAKPFVDSIGFSQGQKQRLAIARALYLDPDIIILDEATSSLDLKTENEICEILHKLKGEKTIIAIAHRISTIKNADKIFLMQNSTIAAQGNFNELYNTNSEFKKLVELNNANFIH